MNDRQLRFVMTLCAYSAIVAAIVSLFVKLDGADRPSVLLALIALAVRPKAQGREEGR